MDADSQRGPLTRRVQSRRRCVALLMAACMPWPGAVHGQVPQQGAARVAELARTENEPLIDVAFDIVREAYRRIGMDAVERTLPGERSVQALNAGEYAGDVIHIAGLEQRYPNLVRVPAPVAYTDMVLVARTDWNAPLPAGWAALAPYTVCIRRGIKAVEQATAGLPRVSSVNQYDNIVRMVKLGRCDVAAIPAAVWLAVDAAELKGLKEVKTMQRWPLYHYVHKSHAPRVEALAAALLAMQRSGYQAERMGAFEQRLDTARRAATR